MDRSPDIAYKIMSAVKSANTRPEVALRKELFRRGMRFRKNVNRLRGKPDIVFTWARLIVFCDGDFWHGHNWAIRGYGSFEEEMKRYSPQWASKIRNNVARDIRITQELVDEGWTVLRIWESDIKKDVKACADQVEYAYWNIRRNREYKGVEIDEST